MAGREMRRTKWTWANGLPFNESTDFAQTHTDYNSYHLQAILAGDLVYKKEYLGNKHNYTCQFFGTTCQSNNFISLKNGCLSISDGVALDFYDARNKCLERGGDLPVIDGQDDLNKYRQVFTQVQNYGKETEIWVGLRRQWWLWNLTVTPEMKFTNWYLDNGFRPAGGCMVAEVTDYLWKQENCTEYKRFFCQTGPANVEITATSTNSITTPPTSIGTIGLTKSTTTTPTSIVTIGQLSNGFIFFIAGISIMVLAIIIVIVVVVVIAKKRKTRMRQTISNAEPIETSYLHLEGRYHGQNNQISDQQYTELHPSTKKRPPLPTPARSLMSQRKEQSPEYIYDDIAEIRAPSYLEVTD